jgi:RecA/RadA recombinase
MNALFNEDNLKKLNEAQIYSIGHLFKADEHILSKKLKIDVSDIQALKQNTEKPQQIIAYSLSPVKCFRTGIDGLDEMLDFIPGKIYEFCGLSATGKTQICNSIAINMAERGCEILYIDTKNDFSAQRICNILLNKSCDETVCSIIYFL